MANLPKTLPFGKYAGWDLRDVPEDYLRLVIDSNGRVIADCEEELDLRAAVEAER